MRVFYYINKTVCNKGRDVDQIYIIFSFADFLNICFECSESDSRTCKLDLPL